MVLEPVCCPTCHTPDLEQTPTPLTTALIVRVDEAEIDKMWSFVQSNRQQRWLWHAIDHQTGAVLAYVLASHEDAALSTLMALLTPFGIQQFYTDRWGSYPGLFHSKNAFESIEAKFAEPLSLRGCLKSRRESAFILRK